MSLLLIFYMIVFTMFQYMMCDHIAGTQPRVLVKIQTCINVISKDIL